MNIDKFKNLPLWTLAVWLVILLCFVLMGCKTKSVTEYVAVHDTLRVHKTDTVRDIRVVTKTDTVMQREIHTYTLDNRGDTVREIHFIHDVERTIVVDSTNRYRAKVDSLQAIVDKLADKEIVRQPTFWERWQRVIDIIITLVGLFTAFLAWWKIRGKNTP